MTTKLLNIVKGLAYMIIGAALLILGISLLLDSCNEPKRQTTEIVVLWDITEKHEPIPTAGEILPLFGLDTDPDNGAVFRFSYASDVSLNRERVFILPQAGNALVTNQFDREREIEKFTKDVSAFLDSVAHDTVGRSQSSIYLPVATALNELSRSSSDRKILLLYSDLRENTHSLSFYNKQTLALLKTDAGAVAAQLEGEMPRANLTGIEVHLLYQPTDGEDDAAYRSIVALYRSMLERKGAVVIVSANLTQ